MTGGPADPATRGPLGLPLLVATIAGLVIAAYLVAVRVMGESPVCGPLRGC